MTTMCEQVHTGQNDPVAAVVAAVVAAAVVEVATVEAVDTSNRIVNDKKQ